MGLWLLALRGSCIYHSFPPALLKLLNPQKLTSSKLSSSGSRRGRWGPVPRIPVSGPVPLVNHFRESGLMPATLSRSCSQAYVTEALAGTGVPS